MLHYKALNIESLPPWERVCSQRRNNFRASKLLNWSNPDFLELSASWEVNHNIALGNFRKNLFFFLLQILSYRFPRNQPSKIVLLNFFPPLNHWGPASNDDDENTFLPTSYFLFSHQVCCRVLGFAIPHFNEILRKKIAAAMVFDDAQNFADIVEL